MFEKSFLPPARPTLRDICAKFSQHSPLCLLHLAQTVTHIWQKAFFKHALAVRLVTDTKIRIERLKIREKYKFGDRILPGGDMYTYHMEFIEWARKYDTGSVDMRSKAKHDEWQKLLQCKQIVYQEALFL